MSREFLARLPARRAVLFLIVLAIAMAWAEFGSRSGRRQDLWRLVHDGCVPAQRLLGEPDPCLRVDAKAGFALVPGFRHADELLLVPIQRISGIEDPVLLAPATPNFWAQAWDERQRLLDGARPIPGDWVGLAVNSARARTQDQFHIHIDCVKAPVHAALGRLRPVDSGWIAIEPLPGRPYLARFVSEAAMRATSPFRLLAAAAGAEAMGKQTLVMIGARGRSGFYLLRQTYDPRNGAGGHGEELLDHRCAALPRDAVG